MPIVIPDAVAPRPSDRLEDLGPRGRLDAYLEGRLDPTELSVWASLYPEEVPLIDGELPWIAGNLG